MITGPQRSGVVGARSRVEVITESSRQKIPFTHFLCFPLYKTNLEKKVDEFKVRVLKDCFEVIFSSTPDISTVHVVHFLLEKRQQQDIHSLPISIVFWTLGTLSYKTHL